MAKKSGGGGGANVAEPAVQTKKKKGGILPRGLSQKELTAFTRQFATLMDAGLPVVRSLDILERQMKPGLLRDAISSVKEDVEGGASLSEAMDAQPRVFNDLYVNMIRAGEAGGVLDTILSRLAEFREKSQRLQRRIIGALVYPTVVVGIACCILVFIIWFIIPKFKEMFDGMGSKLPGVTMMLLSVSDFVGSYWFLVIGFPILMAILYKVVYMNPKGALIMDTIKMHIPVFGIIISKSSISRFTRTLGTLIESGVPILDALDIIKNATGNVVLTGAIIKTYNSIKEGDTIAEPLKDSGVFDELVINMIQVGEETGELDKMLIKIADNYDEEVDALVEGMMSMLEPFLIVGMGGAVGFIVIALFLPLVSIMDKLGGG